MVGKLEKLHQEMIEAKSPRIKLTKAVQLIEKCQNHQLKLALEVKNLILMKL